MEPLIKELRRARKKQNITQSELAAKVGLPQGHISTIERGSTDPRTSTLIQLARVLNHEIMLVPRHLRQLVKGMITGGENAAVEPLWQPDEEEEEED
jgi:HTH-type transcriptional regulator / antitoxin HipB